MNDMHEFEVTLKFSNHAPWSTTFLAQTMADALPQAVEIANASMDLGDMTDVVVDRVGTVEP